MKKFRLSLSILKHNRLFSCALMLIYTLVVSLLVMICFFPESIDSTFQDFMEEYALPEGYIITSLTSDKVAEEMEQKEGVEEVCTSLTFDLKSEMEDGTCYSLRYISMNEKSRLSLFDTENNEDVDYSDNLVAVSSSFAKSNQLSVGSIIKVNDVKLTVTNIVSSPETISNARNSESWYDSDTFGYIYLSEKKMEEISEMSHLVNQFEIYFENSVDEEEVLNELENIESIEVISSTLFENSSVDKQIKAGIEGTRAAVSYLPSLIVLIGLLFSTLFVSQIIRNSENSIALMKVLGYSNWKVISLFVFYSLFLTMISSVAGTGLGYVFLKAMLLIYKNVYDLPTVIISGKGDMLVAIVGFIQLLGIASCILCSSLIVKTDPMLVGKKKEDSRSLPTFITRLGHDSFDKIVSVTIYRNRKRLALSVLCSVACFILSFTALSFLVSKNYGMDALFKDRMTYDARITGDNSSIKEVSSLNSVDVSESKISFAIEYEDETMRLETLIEDSCLSRIYDTEYNPIELEEGEIALEEGFARRHGLSVGEEVIINGLSLKVKCLAREYLYPVMYITRMDAKKLGYSEDNAIDVVLNEKTSMTEFSRELNEIEGIDYYVNIESRENSVRSTLKQLDMPCVFFVVFALITGLVIISNMNLMSIRERKREYATLLTLGVDRFHFFKMSFTEALVQYVFTCIVALPVSLPVASFLLKNMSSFSQEYVMEGVMEVGLITMALIFVYLLVGVFITNATIHKMNVLEVLSSKE